jgi:methionyl aminopeptidase
MHEVKTNVQIRYIRQASRIAGECLVYLRELIRPGATTGWLDGKAEEFIRKKGGTPAFKGYHKFPASICASVNEEVIHGIPGGRRLKEGDILSIDVGVLKEEYYGDAALTVPVGQVDAEKASLLRVTEEALYLGIAKAVNRNHVGDISLAVQEHVEKHGYSVVRDFVGHGVGKELHEEPPIPNYRTPGRGPQLRSGMTLAIEPMVNAGGSEVVIKGDNWTVVTKDGKPSAHFEHTVLVNDGEAEILSLV